ncbi:SCP2 sterol-binding domain-containing protein [Chitiniphilus purpureus]|uniref:Ubiquinone biosynthesis accessory factor UbiT n=1 Tax=Chitiniphilus purpureus TaxID=2981137 RepID=A0ABY6DPS2_9NEIS|nr:SCP2 sterol-binding domain-containing protein [Chitiniphilus sp. CD1]UXY15698.1 SCP2 sterol-binding domain-containing protein [Chitiniphilus sp. CD1]
MTRATLPSRLLALLPETPPACACAQLLNLLRHRLWPDEDFSWLAGRSLRLALLDTGYGVTLRFDGRRFGPGRGQGDVGFAAAAADYWAMALRREDPDTLFFQRRLRIEGDTELGLQLKNLLDATDWSYALARLPAPLQHLLRHPPWAGGTR